MGRKRANRLEYAIDKHNVHRSDVQKKERIKGYARKAVGALAVRTAVYLALHPEYIRNGMNRAKTYSYYNNLAVGKYAEQNGLKEVSGGYAFGAKAVLNGKKVVERMRGR